MGLPDIKVGSDSRVLPKSREARRNAARALTRAGGVVFLAALLAVLLMAGSLSACKNAGTLGTEQTQQPDTGEEETVADGAVVDDEGAVIEDPPDTGEVSA